MFQSRCARYSAGVARGIGRPTERVAALDRAGGIAGLGEVDLRRRRRRRRQPKRRQRRQRPFSLVFPDPLIPFSAPQARGFSPAAGRTLDPSSCPVARRARFVRPAGARSGLAIRCPACWSRRSSELPPVSPPEVSAPGSSVLSLAGGASRGGSGAVFTDSIALASLPGVTWFSVWPTSFVALLVTGAWRLQPAAASAVPASTAILISRRMKLPPLLSAPAYRSEAPDAQAACGEPAAAGAERPAAPAQKKKAAGRPAAFLAANRIIIERSCRPTLPLGGRSSSCWWSSAVTHRVHASCWCHAHVAVALASIMVSLCVVGAGGVVGRAAAAGRDEEGRAGDHRTGGRFQKDATH